MTSKKNGNQALPHEFLSTKYYPEICPECESEIRGVRKMFNGGGSKLQILEFPCPECKCEIYARKVSRYFATGKAPFTSEG